MSLVKISVNISELALDALDTLVEEWNKEYHEMLPGRKNNITRADIIETGILSLKMTQDEKNKKTD